MSEQIAADIAMIRGHVEMLHARAALVSASGKLVIASFGEDPSLTDQKTGKPGVKLRSEIRHVAIGDIETTVDCMTQLTTQLHHNVYIALAVYRSDLPPRERGKLKDVIAIVGLVVDFDDAEAGRWPQRLPAHDAVKLATGMLSVLAALVLGLLIASVKNAFDTTDTQIRQFAATLIQLNQTLADYGPETARPRAMLRDAARCCAMLRDAARLYGASACRQLARRPGEADSDGRCRSRKAA